MPERERRDPDAAENGERRLPAALDELATEPHRPEDRGEDPPEREAPPETERERADVRDVHQLGPAPGAAASADGGSSFASYFEGQLVSTLSAWIVPSR